jgi:hypothetical protein
MECLENAKKKVFTKNSMMCAILTIDKEESNLDFKSAKLGIFGLLRMRRQRRG